MAVKDLRNPIKDQVAIVGIGEVGYVRDAKMSEMAMTAEACIRAIQDAGLTKKDIDGIVAQKSAEFEEIHEGLGIPELYWSQDTTVGTVFGHAVTYAANAVFGGSCNYALVAWTTYRAGASQSARNDPFRARYGTTFVGGQTRGSGDDARLYHHNANPYGAFGWRYLKQYGLSREAWGLLAINNRSNASRTPTACLRTPITMDDYMNARWIREPLALLDMEIPVDSSTALIITTAERAKALKHRPVYIHATSFGENRFGTHQYELAEDYEHLSTWVCMRALWHKSELQLKDVDVCYPYDGFTCIATTWIESMGWAPPGGALVFFKKHWDASENRIKVDGRRMFHTHGGSLSYGGSTGASYFPEAVRQLRGQAANQVPNAKVALLGVGGFFHNSTAALLRAD